MTGNTLIEKIAEKANVDLEGTGMDKLVEITIRTVLEEMRNSIKPIPATAPHDVMIEWLSKHELVNKFAISNGIKLGDTQ